MKKYLFSMVLALLSLVLLAGCIPTIPPIVNNNDPVISSSNPASPLEVGLEQDVTFSVVATDADGDALTYTWTASTGTPSTGSTNAFDWTSPATAGTATITVSVSDGKKAVTKSWAVTVKDGGTVNPSNIVEVTESIATDTTWVNTNIYVIYNDVTVEQALTIQPGTIIKFAPDASLVATTGAQIFADATGGQPIIFTSFADDLGGDTNGENTVPAAGDWEVVGLNNASTSKFINCHFYYGGGNNYPALRIDNSKATVSNCTFANNSGSKGALDAAWALADTVITNNTFYNNVKPLVINGLLQIDNSNVFHNPSETIETNTHNGIYVNAWHQIEVGIIWEETEVPFVLEDDLTISSNGSLITSGTIFKFGAGNSMNVDGNLTATNVIFTSLKDDKLSDTNHDGTATKGTPGDWCKLDFSSTSSATLTNCQFLYGGYDGFPTVQVDNALSFTVTNSTFANNLGTINHPVLDAYWALENTVIENNVFYGNKIPLGVNGLFSIGTSNTFHNPSDTTVTNTQNGIYVNTWHEIETPISWTETEVPFVVKGNLHVEGIGGELAFANNVVVKFMPDTMLVYSYNLVNYNGSGVWFTSYRDDKLGNTDLTSVAPIEGEWCGILLVTNNDSIWQNWGNILYDRMDY